MQRRRSSALEHNIAIRERAVSVAANVAASQSWLERTIKPKKISSRYPIKGKALLFATCGFGSLGDALFGYNSGKLVATDVVNSEINFLTQLRYHVWPSSQPCVRLTIL